MACGITGGVELAGVGMVGGANGEPIAGVAVGGVATMVGATWAAATDTAAVNVAGGPNSSSLARPAPRMTTPPHTEQRARTPVAGILVGSTRNTERHSGQETFTCPP